MNRHYYFMVIAISFLLTSCSDKQKNEKVEPTKVETMRIKTGNVSGENIYSGTIEEQNGSALSFSVMGTIKSIHVSIGQKVSKGTLIATIDESSMSNSYQAAQATLEQAQDAYNRMKLLYDKGSLPEIQWIEIQTKLKQAESTEKISKKNLEDCKLYAPFSGIIAEKNFEVGQNVLPGQAIAKLVTIDKVKVKISVPENEISAINIGEKINVTVSALDNKQFTGTITEKGISANPLSRSYEVKATINNSQGELLPGMICATTLNTDKIPNAVVIPINSIGLDSNNSYFVWTAINGKAHKQPIEVGSMLPDIIIVTSGLSINDEIIVKGQQKVSEGTELFILK